MVKEVFTALTGSIILGGTHYANIRSAKFNIPDIHKLDEIRSFTETYAKRSRPESVADAEFEYVTQDMGILYALGSPTADTPQGPICPLDYTTMNQTTGSFIRIRFASAYPSNHTFTQDRDGYLAGEFKVECLKESVIPFIGSPLT